MTADESSVVDRLAHPDTLLGMLQRGRGKGYLRALETPPEQLWPLLIECVTNDPRMDSMCEERYYPALILASGMDLEPLRAHLRRTDRDDTDWMLGITLGTLAPLAADGHSQAIEVLRDYVSFGHRWLAVARILADLDAPDTMDGIADVLVHRIRNEPGVRAAFTETVKEDWEWYCKRDEQSRANCGFTLPVCEPWKTLCAENAPLAELFAEIPIPYDQPPPPPQKMSEADIRELSLRETFALVNESNRVRLWRFVPDKVSPSDEDYLLRQASSDDCWRRMLAFRGLGQLGTHNGFKAIKSYIEATKHRDRGVRGYAYMAIETLPPELTLETARTWFRSGQNHLHIPAGLILRQHATLDNVPMLKEALRTPETVRDEDFRLSYALEALALFDSIGPIPELETVFCEVAQCFQRYRAADAMETTAPLHFQQHYAFECLWDCHDDTRELGCETVSLTAPGALERLKELADDEDEYDNVRQAAQARLQGL